MLGRLFAAPQVEERDLSYQQIWGAGLDVSTMTTWSGAFVNQANSLQLGAVHGGFGRGRCSSRGVSVVKPGSNGSLNGQVL